MENCQLEQNPLLNCFVGIKIVAINLYLIKLQGLRHCGLDPQSFDNHHVFKEIAGQACNDE